jgi:competence protein ComEC
MTAGFRTAVVSLLALVALMGARPAVAQDPQDLELRFIDVGQGDAILVRNGGKTALIDAGPTDRIVDRLRSLGVTSIDLLVASHNHSDHIGGADALLQAFTIRNYLDNGHPASTAIQRRILELVEAKRVTYLRATPRQIALGDATLRVIPAPIGVGGDGQNNRSVIVVLERGTFKALFSGDSEVEEINALLRSGEIPDVDVLKAAHHGSRNGVTPAWLARTKPEVVVISVGGGNSYGHPHTAALRYYEAGGRRVLRTDRDGDVVFQIDLHGCYETRTERRGALPSLPQEPTSPRRPAPPRSNSVPARATTSCCKVCRSGKACGDSCIARNRTCRRTSGCACDG